MRKKDTDCRPDDEREPDNDHIEHHWVLDARPSNCPSAHSSNEESDEHSEQGERLRERSLTGGLATAKPSLPKSEDCTPEQRRDCLYQLAQPASVALLLPAQRQARIDVSVHFGPMIRISTGLPWVDWCMLAWPSLTSLDGPPNARRVRSHRRCATGACFPPGEGP